MHFSYLLVFRISLASCRAVCFSALVKILAENILGWTDFFVISCFRVLIVVVDFLITCLLFQLFRLGCRTFWRGCGAGPGDKDEVGRVI